MTSATKLRRIVENAEHVVAIELMASAEGLDYRLPLRSSRRIERARELIRSFVPRLAADRPLSRDIQAISLAVGRGDFDEFTQ